ncbi:MAG TPA: CAP domain-containing protein [Thermoanaerobaculia bacterium]|nr:CAP domain-containing protein [Thermoanaerobaculia bacterium]
MTLARIAAIAAAATFGCALVAKPAKTSPFATREPPLPISESYPESQHPRDDVKKAIFDRINEDRHKAGLPPVAWDERASAVADRFCAAQIEERTHGHFLLNGVPPYARTAFDGIFGMQAENAVTWRTTAPKFEESTVSLALSGHASMMAEVPPNDGHRRTILDPEATHVGVGYAVEKGDFRMAQEFLTRRLQAMSLERLPEDPGTIVFRGRVLEGHRVAFVTIAHEPPPRPLPRSVVNARTFYTYPTPTLAYTPSGDKSFRVVDTVTEDRIRFEGNHGFSFRFTPSAAGLWTFVIYTSGDGPRPRPGGLAVLWVEESPRK